VLVNKSGRVALPSSKKPYDEIVVRESVQVKESQFLSCDLLFV